MTNEDRINKLNSIKKLEEQLATIELPVLLRLQKINILKLLKYDFIKEPNSQEKCKEVDELANKIINECYDNISKVSLEEQIEIYKIIKSNYQFLGRRYFKEFMIAIEWDFNQDMKFYDIRKNVFDEWIVYLEQLEYGKLEGLSISAPPRTGKALPLSANILTPTGWVKMKDIKEGMKVIGSNGKPAEVLGVFPQGLVDTYKITFDDETEVKCSGDHLWTVQTREDRKNKKCRTVKTIDMIHNLYVEKGKRKNYSVEYIDPVEFEDTLQEDDLHPYLLGVLLGDGYLPQKKNVKLSNPDDDILDMVEDLLPKTDKLVYERNYDYNITKKKDVRNEKGHLTPTTTKQKLFEYGLIGKKSYDKFIPKKYLYSSINNRTWLLKGLMDTDGSSSNKEKTSTAKFSTTSKQLADDVTELVRSLGGKVIKGEKIGKYKDSNGNDIICRKCYRLYIKMNVNPFYCKRKAENYVLRNECARKNKYLTNIEKVEDEPAQCIYVNTIDHLFVTDGYNLTHNTGIGTIFFMWCMLRHPEKSCFFVSHTSAMAKKVYSDILNMLQDESRNIKSIFPEFEIDNQSAEDMWIQLKTHSSNPYHTAYFRGIDGNMAGILEASWLLYCDDLIKNIEEAMNPTRLETARVKYSVDVTQRKTNKNVKELHIATRWSIHDVISTLETLYSDNEKWKFIKRPAINENGESNFMYKNPFEMDLEHWDRQRNLPDMDEISFNCIYQQEPIERDGLLFSEDNMVYYNGVLPETEPDLVCSYCDVAWGGGDFLSMPIAYVFGNDVYIADVVYNDKSKMTTKPLVKAAIKRNNIVKAGFEANNGGDEYADDISEELKKDNYRCAIQTFRAPTNKSKLARIIACVDEITGIGTGYRLIFLDKATRKNNPTYNLFMQHVFMFNQGAKYQGKQKDDCVDSLAGLITNILESRPTIGVARSRISRTELGI